MFVIVVITDVALHCHRGDIKNLDVALNRCRVPYLCACHGNVLDLLNLYWLFKILNRELRSNPLFLF